MLHDGDEYTTSAPPTRSVSAARSSVPTCSHTPDTINPFKQSILDQLNVSAALADNTEDIQLGLHCAYKKYKAYLEASSTYDLMVADGTWEGCKLSKVDLIQLFMS